MYNAMEDMVKKAVAHAEARSTIKVHLNLFSKGLLPAKVAAKELNMPVEEFLELAKQEGTAIS